MLFKDITILDENLEIQEHRYVGIKEERVYYIGKEAPAEDYGEVYDGSGRLLMSAFFNAHAHSPMTLMRGYGENLSLSSWLNDRIFPFEDCLTGEAVYWATLLGLAESLRFGIVSSTDMYYFCDDMARAVLESGVKNNLGRGITCFTDQPLEELASFRECRSLFECYHGAGGGKLLVDVSLHAEYTSNPVIAGGLADYAKKIDAGMHVHVSETKSEHEECKARHGGMTPVQYLNHLGLFDVRTTAAHCVWVEERDMDILAEKQVTAASCPISNLKLASGVCNAPALLEKGVNVALGTDSVASNNNLNFMEEIKAYALIHKTKWEDPTLITPKEALRAATLAGAHSQGRTDTGKLAEGMRADLIVLDISGPHMSPVHNMVNNLVYSASGSDVVLTMADGKVLYRDGEFTTIDLEKVKYHVERFRLGILDQLGRK
ncbi:MAG: amidohydrolase [Anaerovoracaceae bacterium]|nr:amidohydrolase [Bacillota bacterium]MDY3954821.1 amidohydrolase [Anaerovoracaceae bacterium]